MPPTGSKPQPLTVLIIEDVPTMQALLTHLLESIPNTKVSGQASNVWEARLELQRRRPDVVLLDEILPGESSLDLLQELTRDGLPVYLLTGLKDPDHPVPSGAKGRLFKPGWDTLPADTSRFQAALDPLRT